MTKITGIRHFPSLARYIDF